MTPLHRFTAFAYAFMAASSAWSASLTHGHWMHIACVVVWLGLAGWAWYNGRMDARLREAARMSAMADGMSSVAHAVDGMRDRIGADVACDIAVAAYAAAADVRSDARAILEGKT